eukprot:g43962.t1
MGCFCLFGVDVLCVYTICLTIVWCCVFDVYAIIPIIPSMLPSTSSPSSPSTTWTPAAESPPAEAEGLRITPHLQILGSITSASPGY